jgi:nucleoid-associated protein YgaU
MTICDLAYLGDISEGTSPVGGYVERYKIKRGDTLSGITSKKYDNGSPSCYKAVAKYNGIKNPDKIYAGDTLALPHPLAGC